MVSMRVPLTERVTNALYAALDTYVPEEVGVILLMKLTTVVNFVCLFVITVTFS